MSDFNTPPSINEELFSEKLEVLNDKNDSKEQEQKEGAVFTEEELNKFWNCMLKNEVYVEEFNIKGLKFSFRNKTSQDVKDLMEYLDTVDDSKYMSAPLYQAYATLAVSIEKFMGVDFRSLSVSERIEKLNNNMSEINKLMADYLNKFEFKINKMLEEISSENF